jgi:hypothetical protein
MMAVRAVLCAGWLLAVSAGAGAAAFSRPPAVPAAATPAPSGVCGAELLTQNAVQTIDPGNSVSCNVDGMVHVENSYYRAYGLASFPLGFDVCSVEVGVDRALAGGSTQPVTVNVYANSGAAFPAGSATLIASSTLAVANQTAALMDVPVNARIPPGAQLVLELLTPSGEAAGNSFIIGSNALGQSAQGFLRAPNCGLFTPTTVAAAGFPDMHMVLNARGSAVPGVPNILASPAAIEFGHVQIGHTVTASARLSNTGTADLQISSIGLPPQPFTVTEDSCSGRLLPRGNDCTVAYRFTPLVLNTVSTSLIVVSNGPATSIHLRGTGVLTEPIPGPGAGWLLALALCMGTIAFARMRLIRG